MTPSQFPTIVKLPRADGRRADELRPLRFQNHIAPYATGSTLIEWGQTRVLCGVTIDESVPKWMKEQGAIGGWITAEYSMLPYSTLQRKPRDISKGKIDGRSAAITGAFVALSLALRKLQSDGRLSVSPLLQPVAAASVGVVNGQPMLDLCYTEDVAATVDMNLVMNAAGEFIELQGSGEEATFTETQLSELLALGKSGIRRLLELQQAALM
jgi:ribonuclease PH